jgi:hypothetical protein
MAAPVFDSATVVLGMHRSGTSALAGALRVCGLAAAKSIVPASSANERGFWESAVIKLFDDELLEALGQNWHSLLPIRLNDLRPDQLARARRRASTILGSEYDRGANIILKEPRLCRLLPLWEPVLEKRARRVAYALILRHPVEVARSLVQRNDFDLNHGLLLWARYSLDAEVHTRGKRRLFVSYARLLDGPRNAMIALSDGLDLPIRFNKSNSDALEEYLTADLRHHEEVGDEILAGKPQLIGDSYRILRGWAEGLPETERDHQKLDAAREELDRIGSAVADVLEGARRDRKRWASAKAQVEQTTSEFIRLQRSFEQLQELRQTLAEQSNSIAALALRIGQPAGDQREQPKSSFSPLNEGLRAAFESISVIDARLREALGQFSDRITALQAAQESGFELVDRSINLVSSSVSDSKADLLSQVAIVAQSAEQQAARLFELTAALDDRARLEQALADSMRAGAATTATLERLAEDAARAAEQFALEKAQLESERDTVAADLQAEKEALQSATLRIENLDEELQRTKRKYRAAQWDVERERRARAAARSQLAAAEAAVGRYRASLPLRAYMRLSAATERLSTGGRRAKRKRRNEELQAIASSGLFDAAWYLATYPDVAAAGIDPLAHFVEVGWREGRDAGPGFATSAYLKANPDVARSGINPLFHYIEFGRSEGREIQARRGQAKEAAAVIHDFPDPAPVFRGEKGSDQPVRWLRSYRFDQQDRRAVTAGEHVLGYTEGPGVRTAIEAAFERLADLSGLPAPGGQGDLDVEYTSAALIDAWYTNKAEIRTRWRDHRWPFVVRAYQHDPLQNGRLVLIGEGLLASEIDVLDLSLASPYHSVLLLFAEPEGGLRGARLLAFPSLCRGGLHYSELISRSQNTPDPLGAGLVEALRLKRARNSPDRLVQFVSVDANGGDGTSPMSEPVFRHWLETVAGVTIEASDQAAAAEHEAAANGGHLVLASDMIPTIHVLGECDLADQPGSQSTFLPLLIAGEEPSQPAVLVELPSGASMILSAGASGYPAPWPRFTPDAIGHLPRAPGPAAIRLPRSRDVSELELLVPAAGSALPLKDESSPDVAWLISAGDWEPAELVQAIRALSLQSGASSHLIAFVGDVDPVSRIVANEFFGERVRVFSDLVAVADGVNTSFVGYLGPGVVLHDRRSVSALTALLSDRTTASAACVLVTTEKRGKGWHVSVVDGGTIALDLSNGRTVAAQYKECPLPWRASFAVFRPPRDLWIARASSVKSWIRSGAPQPLRKGMHVCTSLVTASYLGARAEHAFEVPLPSASAGRSTKTKTLFG